MSVQIKNLNPRLKNRRIHFRVTWNIPQREIIQEPTPPREPALNSAPEIRFRPEFSRNYANIRRFFFFKIGRIRREDTLLGSVGNRGVILRNRINGSPRLSSRWIIETFVCISRRLPLFHPRPARIIHAAVSKPPLLRGSRIRIPPGREVPPPISFRFSLLLVDRNPERFRNSRRIPSVPPC